MNTALPKKGHPRGLYVLFFTEMWERFGYYLMVGILYLFLHDTVANGGRGMDVSLAADITGSYIALVYLTPFHRWTDCRPIYRLPAFNISGRIPDGTGIFSNGRSPQWWAFICALWLA